MAPREKEPPVHKGDRIRFLNGTPSGAWDVLDARWAREEEESRRIRIVLGRGSMKFRTDFNPKTMRHESAQPPHVLARELRLNKPVQFKPR